MASNDDSTGGLFPQLDEADDQMTSTPDTPPATGSQQAFFQSQTQQAEHGPGQQDSLHGMETPPPSAMHSFTRRDSAGMLPTPPPAHTSAASSQEKKSLAETFAQAGWGGKKAVEEYETVKERLLDGTFDLSWAGDDNDESDMWRK